jgi:hypothetical protein
MCAPLSREGEEAGRKEVSMQASQTGDPIHHTRKMSAKLEDVRDHLRADIEKVDEPQFRALFEAAAEVIGALITTFRHYEEKQEPAWRKS